MRQSNLLGRLLASSAVALSGAVVAVGAGIATPAYAQDYTSGSVNGTVTDESGAPISGATVTVTSNDQGFKRSATTTSTGSFNFPGLPGGSYNVDVNASGQPTWTAEGVRVLASQATAVDAVITGTEAIVVTGARFSRDFASTTSGINIDVADLVKSAPIGRDLTSLVLLAPGTSVGESQFGNLASIGGSSVAENAYYINGLNITNFDNYLGSANVPFEFYKSVEVKSGGYPAEFGRATGGIINAVSKSGTNDFMAAIHVNWTPDFLRTNGKDLLSCNFDDPGETDPNGSKSCTRSTNRAADTADSYSAIVEAGGPIFKDRLFVYGLLELRETRSLTHNVPSGTAFQRKNSDPFWAVKVDAYPLDNHHLEFTIFDSSNTTVRNDIAFNEVNGVPVLGLAKSVYEFNGGGVSYVGKYTGNLTDWLTVSAAYGKMRDRFDFVGTAGDAGLPYVWNRSGGTLLDNSGNPVGNLGTFTGQTNLSISDPYRTERKFWRGDVDLRFSAVGEHHIRAGFDVEDNTLTETGIRTGGQFLLDNGYMTAAAFNAGTGMAGIYYRVRPSSGGSPRVELNYFNSSGAFDAKNKAFYIQDEWKPTDRLTLTLGLRRDDFSVNRADGTNLVNMKENYAPRLGASYKLWEDESGELYGYYGRYFLPFASNTAFRMTGYEYFFRERWNYSGFDANNIPILTTQVTTLADHQSACPFALTPGSSGFNCAVTGDGTVGDSSALIAHNLKATAEDEFIIGYRHKLNDLWSVGLSYTHRKLIRSAEDAAIDAAVLDYCDAEGISGCSSTWTGFHQYVIINPGQDVVVNLDGLDGREVTFKADALGYPAAKRTYDAVEFSFERKFDGKWSLQGSYTWSKSKGNSEGFVQSDFGQDDAGITQDFDQPGFNEGAYGYLPNHRQHRFKVFGSYALADWFTVGANFKLESPRKLSCIGYHPTDAFAQIYGAASHYCGGVLSPRGSAQESEWVKNVDLSFRVKHEFGSGQTVTLRADVFNLFNSQAIQDRYEFGDLDFDGTNFYPDPDYGQPTVYQTPRSVRLGLDITF